MSFNRPRIPLLLLPLLALLPGAGRPVGLPADCNQNGIEDAVDIAFGTSSDVDQNGVPDECEEVRVPRIAPGGAGEG